MSNAGLFANLKNGSLIENLTISAANITAKDYIGVLAGKSAIAKIKNVNVQGTIWSQNSADSYAGGLVGYAEDNEVQNINYRYRKFPILIFTIIL